MRCMKIAATLLAVPLCLMALACDSPTAIEQPEALTDPPAPSFDHEAQSNDGFPVILANGCSVTVGVTQRRGGTVVVGTAGDDAINCHDYTGSRGVTVWARGGNDLIVGSQRNDFLSGGRGCDRVEGNLGNDVVLGGPGNDNGDCQVPDYANATPSIPVHIPGGLFGDVGNDLVIGGRGDDDLTGGGGTDRCFGGPGADTFTDCDVEG